MSLTYGGLEPCTEEIKVDGMDDGSYNSVCKKL